MKLSDIDILSIGNTVQMAGAVFHGDGKLLLCMFPDDRGDVFSGEGRVLFGPSGADEEHEVHVLDMGQDDWQRLIRQTDLLEAEVVQRSSDGSLAKVVLRKSQRQIEQSVSWGVFRRDGYACRYCGADDVPLTVDHVVCWEEGGPSVPENLVAACRKCNKVRGNTPYEQWLLHPRYAGTSKKLSEAVRRLNEALVAAIPSIPRLVNARSR